MHIEILVEDSSGAKLLETLIPKIIGEHGAPHTWNLHSYKGVGRIPKNLNSSPDPAKRILLDRLPRILAGYGKTPGIDAVVVLLDADKRNCVEFLAELRTLHEGCQPTPKTLFRLAIEEIEAWYLGDPEALRQAFPRTTRPKWVLLRKYVPDSQCNTWEFLADIVYPGGASVIKKKGWPLPGQIKHDWAQKVGPLLVVERNRSPSFKKLCSGLLRLISEWKPQTTGNSAPEL
ncbi:MAG TPA: DUF4276 family protein [Pseudomonadota bacterium]|nr:DUF4276 family protein [Pseudomonadota bacterium]